MNYQRLREELMLDEGVRLKPYQDTVGKWTIGVGRNLSDVGISKDECQILLDNDIRVAVEGLDRLLPWWRGLTEIRQHVLINMVFNMGIVGLMGFKNMLAAVQGANYGLAADEMINSVWCKQVGARALRLASLMRHQE